MKLKQIVAKAMIVGGCGLPALGLGIGVANADTPSRPPGPTPRPVPTTAPTKPVTAMVNGNRVRPTTMATPFTSRGTPASGLTTAGPTTTGTPFTFTGTSPSAPMGSAAEPRVVSPTTAGPTTTATPFGGAQGRSSAEMTGLNPHGRAGPTSTDLPGTLRGLLGPLGGLLG